MRPLNPDHEKCGGTGVYTFVTEYTGPDGSPYGGYIEATCLHVARDLAVLNGRGERIVGVLGAVVTADGQIMEDRRVV
jgi:hypothetical protein